MQKVQCHRLDVHERCDVNRLCVLREKEAAVRAVKTTIPSAQQLGLLQNTSAPPLPMAGHPIPIDAYVAKLGRPSYCWSQSECADAEVLCEGLKQIQKDMANEFLEPRGQQPILFAYQADATPISSMVRFCQQTLAGNKVTRSGKQSSEYLLQRAYLKSVQGTNVADMCLILADPKPLHDGKTAWHLYQACVEFCPLLQEKKVAHSVVLSHYSFDRAVQEAVCKRIFRRHACFHDSERALGIPEAEFRELLDLPLFTGCCNHDVHNALKWGMASHLESDAFFKRLQSVMQSLRNSYGQLRAFVPIFLQQYMRFSEEPFDPDEVREFWVSLGVSPSILEDLVELNPVWDGTYLNISVEDAASDLILRMSAIILQVMDFRLATESRWLSVGSGCRSIVGCEALGLSGLVGCLCRDPAQSDYHIGAFRQHIDELLPGLVVCSLGSYVADGLLQTLLEDDRVLLVQSQLEQHVCDELHWIQSLGMSTFKRLARTCHWQASSLVLRAEIVNVSVVSAGYFSWKVLRVARSHPWSLTAGDVDAKLQELRFATDVVDDLVVRRLQRLLQLGSSTQG